MSTKFVFDLTLKEQEVTITDKGVPRDCVIRELTGPSYAEYMKLVTARTKFNKAGDAVGFRSFDGLYSGLLKLCMYDRVTNHLLPEEQIASWPISVQEALADIAKELSGMVRGGGTEGSEEDEEKNF